MKRKTDPDIKALKEAVNALLSMSSETVARASANYIYSAFVANPDKSTKEHFAKSQPDKDTPPPAALAR